MAVSLPEKILQYLDKHGSADSLSLAEIFNEDGQKIVGAIKSLDSLGDVISMELFSKKQLELTSEGVQVAENGSHEALVYNAVPAQGIPQPELMKNVPNAKVGFSKAMSAGWISLDKSSGQPVIRRKVDQICDVVQQSLAKVTAGNAEQLTEEQKQEYKKRKLLQESVVKGFLLKKGSAFSLSVSKPETDLTPEMIAQGSWRNKQFKDYNLGALGVPPPCGHLHPLLKVRTEFRQIFLEMGFTEMPTNNYVESSFWNFDALYVPQQHPARDAHDTFFTSKPKLSKEFPMDYLERVKSAHSHGGFGSQGYKYDWKIEESQKNVLRTHTTAVSARMLHALAKKGFEPVKYFSIDKVFRNETLDATHLAEFHQVEGVVAGYNISLGDLIGLLHEFFKKLGIEKLYFKPAFNPYTEPSMEIFSYHEGLKKWIEIGNSGMFRPEMLLPMGLPENVNVLGYGLSLERPTMIKYGIDNIRDLVGPKVDLQMVHDSPICRIDKDAENEEDTVQVLEKQWDGLMTRLQALQSAVTNLKSKLGMQEEEEKLQENFNITLFADPKVPPYSLFILIALLKKNVGLNVSSHCHSTTQKLPTPLINMINLVQGGESSNRLSLIWKPVGVNVELLVSPILHTKLVGEVTAVRYLSRLIESYSPQMKWFEKVSPYHSSQVDFWMDQIHAMQIGSKTTHALLLSLDKQFPGHSYIVGDHISPADIYLLSVLRNIKPSLPYTVQSWHKKCKTNDWVSPFV